MTECWSLNVRILDRSARPIDVAAVSICQSPEPVADVAALTGPDGLVSISVPSAGEFGILVRANGMPAAEHHVDAVKDDSFVTITLDA